MPQLLQTIEEFIATDIQRQGYWIVFNRGYNDVHAFRKPIKIDGDTGLRDYLDREATDEIARAEFVSFMKDNFPKVRLIDVFDCVSTSFITWPYLGSIAIDMQPGDAVYAALSEKYGDPELDAIVNNAVLWTMKLEDAQASHADRVSSLEGDW